MKAVIGVLALSLLSEASAQSIANDWMVIPGVRVGPISESTSEAELEDIFGGENLKAIDVELGEGFREPGTAVFPNDAARRIEIVWSDGSRSTPREVRITGESSNWSTSEGISLGSTLKEIEQMNGYPFRLAGFAFDYGGTITNCGRGRLVMLGCDGGSGLLQGRQLVLRLSPSTEARTLPEYREVIGDRDFSSGHPAMQVLDPGVYQMIVFLGRESRSGSGQ